ncbi:MAG: outer-membrane lipoprotein carrier protein LolA [Bacteroidales bacterium]|nr:outer-membrane lipoprotein carrier protein LolA [Bacteroidales bacterium]
MKKLFTILLLSIACISAMAQLTHTDKGAVDEGANAFLKKAAAKMNGTVSFSVSVVNLDANKKETFRQKAEVLYSAPRYRVKAGDLEIYCDGKSVWQYNRPANEVVVNNLTTSDDDLTNPAKLLANYQKSFRAKFIREEDDGTVIIDLQPYRSNTFHKVRLFINGKTLVLKKMEQHNYDSSRGEYTITNFKNAQALDTDFAFDTKSHPKVEVVDMR